MNIKRKKKHLIPELNTASLPDLIFSVLFFFMIVTTMRQTTIKVKYRVPQGKELSRLTKRSTVSYIYIGKPAYGHHYGNKDQTYVQLNDKIVSPTDIKAYLSSERRRMKEKEKEQMSVVIRADRDTKMRFITEIKQAMRQAKVLNINYSATENAKGK